MRACVLTLDLGNSALKLARWGPDSPLQRVPWHEDWAGALGELLDPRAEAPVEFVAISSVAAGERLDEVVGLCGAAGREVLVNPRPELEIACRDPHTIGKDRLYAAAGAWAASPEAALVVDAGTALTVDALGDGGRVGIFLGGAIAPGPELLARALAQGGAQLFEVDYDPLAPALGRDSAAALRAGVSVGFRGAVLELVRCVGREAGLESAPLWLTGGASVGLDVPGFLGARTLRRKARLVHLGLLAALGRTVA